MMSGSNDTTRSPSATMKPSALRGGQTLSAEELQAHLAAVTRLENVGVLLGAGASQVLGGQTMDEIWKNFSNKYPESKAWLEQKKFVPSGDGVNLEEIIDALEAAKVEWKRLQWSRRLSKLNSARNDLRRAVVNASILKQDWWKYPSAIQNQPDLLASHCQLLHKLTAARQPGQPSPWIFTTNYDLAVEWAAETISLKVMNGFDGLHRRTFSPHNFDLGYRNTLARGEARFGTYGIHLAKLHGSLTWCMDRSGTVIEHSTSYLWSRISRFMNGDQDTFSPCITHPSTGKYQHTTGFVSGELIRRFTEFLTRPQSCLIISGYSFSDEHLNRVLESGLQNPTLQIVACHPKVSYEEDGPNFKGCSGWFKRMSSLGSPRVTIVGGGSAAYFNALVGNIPDPVIFDEQSERMREMIKKYKEFMHSSRLRDEKGQ